MDYTLLDSEKQISAEKINKYLTSYLNDLSDRMWQILTPYFMKSCRIPLFRYKDKLLTYADLYEIVLAKQFGNKKITEREQTVRPYSDWLTEAQKHPTTSCLQSVYDLKEYLDKNFTRDELLGYYIYGSISDLSYIEGWSDLDAMVIIRKAVLNDTNWLRNFKKRLLRTLTFSYLFNPLSLHRYYIVTEYDLEAFVENSSYLKGIENILNMSFEVSSYSNKYKFRYLDSECKDYLLKEKLKNFLQEAASYYKKEFLKLKNKKNLNAFEWKFIIASVLATFRHFYRWNKGRLFYLRVNDIEDILDDFYALSPKSKLLIKKLCKIRKQCHTYSIYPYGIRKWIGLNWDFRLLGDLHKYLDWSIKLKIPPAMSNTLYNDILDFYNDIKEVTRM